MPLGGLMPILVLKILSKNPMHGYQIEEELSNLLKREIPEGFIYSLLKRLEIKGLVVYKWEMPSSGPARKVYILTEEGKTYLEERTKQIEELKSVIDFLVSK